MRRLVLFLAGCAGAALVAGCAHDDGTGGAAAPAGGASEFTPASTDDTPVVHGPAQPLPAGRVLFGGEDVLDVSTDRGGGVWAVSAGTVFYLPPGAGAPFTYDQGDGLARGQRTWKDTYYSGTQAAPLTFPVTFAAVAGATAGQAIVGNVGAIADRLSVDPAGGAVQRVDNMKVTAAQFSGAGGEELGEHVKRVVATHRIVVDLDGAWSGTAYLGGWHGFEAFHGLNGDCGCLAFEEHQHFIPGADRSWCDSAGSAAGCWGGDVRGMALSRDGDVWAGDRHFVQRLRQGSLGAHAGLFDSGATWTAAIDVFPAVRDEVSGLAVDGGGGVWVASDGNGLAYLTAGRWTPSYWGRQGRLPMNRLRGVVVDGGGRVWVATAAAGLACLEPRSGTWTYYTAASGLPSDEVRALYRDRYGDGRTLYVATAAGVIAFATP